MNTQPRPALRHNPSFRFLYASDTVSALGDRFHALALYILVYDLTGRALDLGLVAIAQILPGTLIAPLSGWLVDRVDRRRMMIYMDLARAGLVLLLPLLDTLPEILTVGLLLALAEQFHTPARLAILPDLVNKADVVRANAITISTGHLLLIVGPATAGVLIAAYGTTLAFQINAATYVVSALLLLGLRGVAAPVREALATGRELVRQFVGEVKEGVGVVLGDPPLRFAIAFFALLTLVSSLQQPITLVFVKDVLEAGDDSLGWIIASAGLGGILGGVLVAWLGSRLSPLRAITAACALDGLALIGFALVRNLPGAMALFLVFGLLGSVIQVLVVSLFQLRLPEEKRGRALGWLGPVFGPISIGSVGLGTMLADRFGVVAVMLVSGGLQAVLGFAAVVYLLGRPALGKLDGARIAAVALALLTLAGCNRAPARSPDIVLLSIDTLRADHLGCYGGREVSPFLDSLAARGTRFDAAWSPSPWTLPSHATMLTGQLPFQHGAIEQQHRIAEAAPRLPAQLRAAGYRTAAAVTSVYVSERYGVEQGFDHFHDFGIVEGTLETQETLDAEQVFTHGLEWMREQGNDVPVFLFLHVFDVHYPYEAPAPWNARLDPPARPEAREYENYFHYLRNPVPADLLHHLRNQYDEELLYVDDAFRRFVEAWSERRPDTVFVVTSDHGEEFGERGSWGHAHTLTPEQLHVPWIVAGPGVRRQVIDGRVGLEDLAPTLAGLADASFPAVEGVDRSEQLRTGEVPEAAPSARFASTSRFRTLKHRWHQDDLDLVQDLVRNQYAIFDLAEDPRATRNLFPERTEDLQRGLAAMYQWLGQPWELRQNARIETDGVIVAGAVRQGSAVDAPAGLRFAVFPLDAQVRFLDAEGTLAGPFQVLGGKRPPEDHPLVRWQGGVAATLPAELSPEDRERLRALGYIE